MNKYILAFITFLTIITNVQGQWEILNEGGSVGGQGSTPLIRTIDFVNDQVGWIAHEKTLFKTEDGGETWVPINSDWSIWKIDFLNEDVGWAVASADFIIKTIDGGQSWEIQTEAYEDIYDLHAINENFVVAVGNEPGVLDGNVGLVLITKNGGSSWEQQSLWVNDNITELRSVYFLNSDTGMVFGFYWSGNANGVVYKTYDAGNTWEEQKLYEEIFIDNFQFINDSTGYFLLTQND